MRQSLLLTCSTLCLLAITLCGPARADDQWKAWTPDKSVADKLASPAPVGAFKVQAPKGYSFSHTQQNANTEVYGWRGASRKDGLSPSFLIDLTPKAGDTSLHDILDAYVDTLERSGLTDIDRGKPERGAIDGIHFIRVYWTATMIINKHSYALQGFVYVGKQGSTMILMSSQDVMPYQTEALKVAESSAMSLTH